MSNGDETDRRPGKTVLDILDELRSRTRAGEKVFHYVLMKNFDLSRRESAGSEPEKVVCDSAACAFPVATFKVDDSWTGADTNMFVGDNVSEYLTRIDIATGEVISDPSDGWDVYVMERGGDMVRWRFDGESHIPFARATRKYEWTPQKFSKENIMTSYATSAEKMVHHDVDGMLPLDDDDMKSTDAMTMPDPDMMDSSHLPLETVRPGMTAVKPLDTLDQVESTMSMDSTPKKGGAKRGRKRTSMKKKKSVKGGRRSKRKSKKSVKGGRRPSMRHSMRARRFF